MRRASLGFGIALCAAACQSGTRQLDGAKLFGETCAKCHGVDGHGDPTAKAQLGVPDMTDAAWQAKLADDDIRRTVREGSKSKKMPPFGGFYDGAQLDALVAHVRAFGPGRR